MTLLNQAQFAKKIGRHRSYVTELKQNGRLVMRAGKVDVEKTLELMEQTKDPAKDVVAERHETDRQQKAVATANPPQDDLPAMSETGKAGSVYQQSRAIKAKYDAMAAKRDYELSIGTLLVASDVSMAISDAAVTIRQRLESLPDVLSAQFAAETDEQKIRVAMHDQIEMLLRELSRKFGDIGRHE